MTRVECFIGCAACKTVLFRVDSVERAGTKAGDHTGVFQHVLVKLGTQDDHWKCADCGVNLERVPAPNVDDVNIVSRETFVK